MSKHTPEPWAVEESITGNQTGLECVQIVDKDEHDHIASIQFNGMSGYSDGGKPDFKVAKQNAKRIVACVNACQGLGDPSVVPELVEFLKTLTKDCREDAPESVDCDKLQALRLLARAEGRS